MKVDLVYKIGKRDNDTNFELRHSIRSAVENFVDLGKIYIVGHKPDWAINVIHIPIGDPYKNNKDANLINKLLRACQEESLSQEFLNMSDDYFFLEKIGKDYFDTSIYDNEIISKITPESKYSKWDRRLLSTLQILKEKGYEQNIYDLHMPVLIDKTKYKEVMLNYDYGWDNGYCGNTLYFNTIKKKGREVVKNKSKEQLIENKRQNDFVNSMANLAKNIDDETDKQNFHIEPGFDSEGKLIEVSICKNKNDNRFPVQLGYEQKDIQYENEVSKVIDDKIEEWHNSNSDKTLQEYLGLSKEDYKSFVENNSFDEIILEQEANQLYDINEKIKQLEEERTNLWNNAPTLRSGEKWEKIDQRTSEIGHQLVDLYEQKRNLEIREEIECKADGSINTLESEEEFLDFTKWKCQKRVILLYEDYDIEELYSEYLKEKSEAERIDNKNSKLSNNETEAQRFEVPINVNNETKMKLFQNITAKRIYVEGENIGSEDLRAPIRAIEFTLLNDEGQEVKVIKTLQELGEVDKYMITHSEEKFRNWLLNNKESVDYQSFNDICRLYKQSKSVEEIQIFTTQNLIVNYSAIAFNKSMEKFLALRFNKLCIYESK